MPSHVTSLLSQVERERKAINAIAGPQVQSKSQKEKIRLLVECYFNETRVMLDDATIDGSHIASVDGLMQNLLQLTHKDSSKAKYKTALRELKRHLVLLDSWLIATPLRSTSETREGVDDRIVQTLRALSVSATSSYEQALIDLSQDQRSSWRGPATDLREALRETLDKLAPDAEVTAAPGFKQEKDAHGPTMKQKVRFILKSRNTSKSIAATTEDATSAVDEAIGMFVRSVYTRSSVSTHTPTSKDEVVRILNLVRVVLAELLEVR